MTVEGMKLQLSDYDATIAEQQRKLDDMRPAFLFDYDAVDKCDEVLQNLIDCRDMLAEILKEAVEL